jgi:hypothetical protein
MRMLAIVRVRVIMIMTASFIYMYMRICIYIRTYGAAGARGSRAGIYIYKYA